MIWFLASLWVLVGAVAWSWFAIAAPQTREERREEDDMQAKFLQERAESMQKARRKPKRVELDPTLDELEEHA